MNKFIEFYNKNLSLWVVGFSAIAFFFPNPFLFLKYSIKIFFAITMFGIGLVITEKDYKSIIRSPRAVFIGNIAQFIIMPFLAFIVSLALNLPKEMAVGLILTGSAPGAMTSNVISYLSDGDVAFSVAMTFSATLLCPILTPLLTLLLAGKMVPVPFISMFFTILYTIVLPLILGFIIRKKYSQRVSQLGDIPAAISVSAIVVICSYVVAANKGNFGKTTILVLFSVIIVNLFGMLLGYFTGFLADFDFKRKKTLSIEIGMQNAGLGVILALSHFSKIVAVPAAIFTIWCVVSASMLVNFWKYFENRELVAE